MSDLTVYTTPTCPWCSRLKSYLKEKKVSYDEVDVSTDYEAAMKLVDLTGQRSVPVLAKGERYVVGFDPEQIDRVLQ